ncbi:GTP-binding protein [Bacillus sp. SCS-151]|uniref:GTP-binding protein n=1 Tax=Nanhaiella sioensis TaxID=3115293 RepID=UPI00397A1B43
MTVEQQLINKSYYETFMGDYQSSYPIRVLGELFVNEQQREQPELSFIRYAQGEVYYLSNDYEAAIFKWEKVENELKPWAQKNIADAYLELQMYAEAEHVYSSIITTSNTLTSEISLKLHTLYIDQGNTQLANKAIRDAVAFNPDYSNVTKLAQNYFEEQEDYFSMIELAKNEAVRLGSIEWYNTLMIYIDEGWAKSINPDLFKEPLLILYQIDLSHFESMVQSLWMSYKDEEYYFAWITVINEILVGEDDEDNKLRKWEKLSELYKKSYIDFLHGPYSIKELAKLVPIYLHVWKHITPDNEAMFVSAAILSWNEVFNGDIPIDIARQCEQHVLTDHLYENGLEDSLTLFDDILTWSDQHSLHVGNRLKWLVNELTSLQTQRVLIASAFENGKATFINSLVGDHVLAENRSTPFVVFNNGEKKEIKEVLDSAVKEISSLSEFHQTLSFGSIDTNTIFDFKLPSTFLQQHQITMMNTPGFLSHNQMLLKYLPLADSLIFVLDSSNILTEKEVELLIKLQERNPSLPVHFVSMTVERDYYKDIHEETIADTKAIIHKYFPNARIFSYTKHEMNKSNFNELANAVKSGLTNKKLMHERTKKILYYIRETITYILQKRIENEQALTNEIQSQEEMVSKLNGAINQLSDIEKEKVQVIINMFRSRKEEYRAELEDNIPRILKECSNIISELSDLGTIHHQINEEMNMRIQQYIEQTTLPKLRNSIEQWVEMSGEVLRDSQEFLTEMSVEFNKIYEEEKVKLECDFKLLDDWRRDANRLAVKTNFTKQNIFLRRTPSQMMLKSAGKLFGMLQPNNEMIYNKYKSFVENEDYLDVTDAFTNQLLERFNWFEQSLAEDISSFFTQPHRVLDDSLQEMKQEIDQNTETLMNMRSNPQLVDDPVSLFTLRHKLQEWLIKNK